MPFVAVFVFRQKLQPSELDRVAADIPAVFERLAQARGEPFDPRQVDVAIVDEAARDVFSPESHAKGFQGLDMLLLVFAGPVDEEASEGLREALEDEFRDRWVARARMFALDAAHWRQALG